MKKRLLIAGLSLLMLTACKQETPDTEPIVTEPQTEMTEPVTEPETEPETEAEPVTEAEKIEPLFKDRYPYAIMIDNHPNARPQAGLNDAKIIYEAMVEGRITRLMMVTDQEKGKVGPIRSARPLFVDLAYDNQAFYAHVGNYEYVLEHTLGYEIKDMDQFHHAGNSYYRESHKAAPHNMYGTMEEFYNAAENEGYELKPESAYGYSMSNQVQERDGGVDATEVSFTYDDYEWQIYYYNKEKEMYEKKINDVVVTDENTGDPLEIANYILMPMEYYTMSNGEHQAVDWETQEGEAYYFTKGKMYPITWERSEIGSFLTFKRGDEELVFNPGLLYIQLIPTHRMPELP